MKPFPALGRGLARALAGPRSRRTAPLLPRTRLGGPMPWVMAIMVALTVLAGGAALALDNVAQGARRELAAGATVQILEPDPALRARQAQAVATLLAQQPEVTAARVVPEEEVARLLEPWLGPAQGLDGIPFPALVDVTFVREADDSAVARLRARVLAAAPQARIDAESDWLAPVLNAITTLRWMAIGLIVLLGSTAAAAVWLAARNALGVNRDTLEIVHLLGGSDSQISGLFQRSILIDASLGGAAGFALGSLALWLLARQFAALDSGLVAAGGLARGDWLVLALIPLCAVGIAVYTARLTVLSSLRKIL